MQQKYIDDLIKLITKEDGEYLKKTNEEFYKNGLNIEAKLEYIEEKNTRDYFGDSWAVPTEACYCIAFTNYYDGVPQEENCTYIIGKETNNIYVLPHQGSCSVYRIKNNKVIVIYKWLGDGESYEWRN